MKDRLLRTLADMENLRERTARTTAETKQYAVQVRGQHSSCPALPLEPHSHARLPVREAGHFGGLASWHCLPSSHHRQLGHLALS